LSISAIPANLNGIFGFYLLSFFFFLSFFFSLFLSPHLLEQNLGAELQKQNKNKNE